MEIQIQDVLAFIALFVAINAVLGVSVFYIYDKRNEMLRAENRRLWGHTKVLERDAAMLNDVVQSMVDCLKIADARQTLFWGLIDRLLHACRVDAEAINRIQTAQARIDRDKERVFNELMTFSSDPKTRLSAFRQLAESYGTLSSLAKMDSAVARIGPEDDVARGCIRVLRRRLEGNGAIA